MSAKKSHSRKMLDAAESQARGDELQYRAYLLDKVGGFLGLAEKTVKEFENATVGSPGRREMLKLMHESIFSIGGAGDDDLVPTADLEAQVRRLQRGSAQRLREQQSPTTPPAVPAPAGDAAHAPGSAA